MSYIASQVSGPSRGVTLHSSFHLSQQYVRMALTHIQRGFLYIAVNSCGTKLAVMSALALARILLVNGAPLLPNIEFQCVSSQENIQRDTLSNSASFTYILIICWSTSQEILSLALGLISINLNLEDPTWICAKDWSNNNLVWRVGRGEETT